MWVVWAACGRGAGDGPMPVPGFGILGGQRVLLLPVHYVQPVAGGWLGAAGSAEESLRQANAEIAFAVGERRGTTQWIFPEEIARVLGRQPALQVHVYALSADPIRRENAGRLEWVKDPLYGEVRAIAALFDARYAVFPVELGYEEPRSREETEGHGALWTVLFDARTGIVLWSGTVRGEAGPAASGATVARVAQALARQLVP